MAPQTFSLFELPVELIMCVQEQMIPVSQRNLSQTCRFMRALYRGPRTLTRDMWHAFNHTLANGRPGHRFCLVCHKVHTHQYPIHGLLDSQCTGVVSRQEPFPNRYVGGGGGDFHEVLGPPPPLFSGREDYDIIQNINVEWGYLLHWKNVQHVMTCHRQGLDVRRDLARFAYAVTEPTGCLRQVDARIGANGHFLLRRTLHVPAVLRRTRRGAWAVRDLVHGFTVCGHADGQVPGLCGHEHGQIFRGYEYGLRPPGTCPERRLWPRAPPRRNRCCPTTWHFRVIPGDRPEVVVEAWYDFGPGGEQQDELWQLHCSRHQLYGPVVPREDLQAAWDTALEGEADEADMHMQVVTVPPNTSDASPGSPPAVTRGGRGCQCTVM